MKAPIKAKILAPAGSHVARLVGIVYLGTQTSQFGEAYKVRLTWELPNELNVLKEGEGEKPFVVSKKVTLSMHEKSTLRKIVQGILGYKMKDEEASVYDIDELLGKACLITVTHAESEKGIYAEVDNITTLPKGMICPPAVNKLQLLSYEKWDEELYQSLPKFIQEEIVKTPEYKKMRGAKVEDVVDESEIPF